MRKRIAQFFLVAGVSLGVAVPAQAGTVIVLSHSNQATPTQKNAEMWGTGAETGMSDGNGQASA